MSASAPTVSRSSASTPTWCATRAIARGSSGMRRSSACSGCRVSKSAALVSPRLPFDINFNQTTIRIDGKTYESDDPRRGGRERRGVAGLLRDARHSHCSKVAASPSRIARARRSWRSSTRRWRGGSGRTAAPSAGRSRSGRSATQQYVRSSASPAITRCTPVTSGRRRTCISPLAQQPVDATTT